MTLGNLGIGNASGPTIFAVGNVKAQDVQTQLCISLSEEFVHLSIAQPIGPLGTWRETAKSCDMLVLDSTINADACLFGGTLTACRSHKKKHQAHRHN